MLKCGWTWSPTSEPAMGYSLACGLKVVWAGATPGMSKAREHPNAVGRKRNNDIAGHLSALSCLRYNRFLDRNRALSKGHFLFRMEAVTSGVDDGWCDKDHEVFLLSLA